MKKVVLAIFASFVLSAVITSCSEETPEEQAPQLSIDNDEVKEDDI